jgi:hypothetical protein
VAARHWGGETWRCDDVSQWRRCSDGPLGIPGGPAAPREEEEGEGHLKSQGVQLRWCSLREGGRRRGDSKSGVPRDGLRWGSGQMEPGGDEGSGGSSILVACCADKGDKVEERSTTSLHQNKGRNGGSGGLGVAC